MRLVDFTFAQNPFWPAFSRSLPETLPEERSVLVCRGIKEVGGLRGGIYVALRGVGQRCLRAAAVTLPSNSGEMTGSFGC